MYLLLTCQNKPLTPKNDAYDTEKRNGKEPKMKRARKAAAKPAAESAPYVEQVSELLMVHNKNDPKAGVQTVSEADEKATARLCLLMKGMRTSS